jgi:hypothetical protein
MVGRPEYNISCYPYQIAVRSLSDHFPASASSTCRSATPGTVAPDDLPGLRKDTAGALEDLDKSVRAAEVFAEQLATDRVPSVRAIRGSLPPRARHQGIDDEPLEWRP